LFAQERMAEPGFELSANMESSASWLHRIVNVGNPRTAAAYLRSAVRLLRRPPASR